MNIRFANTNKNNISNEKQRVHINIEKTINNTNKRNLDLAKKKKI